MDANGFNRMLIFAKNLNIRVQMVLTVNTGVQSLTLENRVYGSYPAVESWHTTARKRRPDSATRGNSRAAMPLRMPL
jgi:hypothetical protein